MVVRHSSEPRGSVADREDACDLRPVRGTAASRQSAEGARSAPARSRGGMLARLVASVGLVGVAACSQTAGRGPVWEMFLSGGESQVQPAATPLSAVEGVPPETVQACQNSLAVQASAHGATQVEAVSAGTPTRLPNGLVEAPIEARIVYEQEAQTQVRQARIACRLNDQGSVVELL